MTYKIRQTRTFAQWHAALRDMRARIAIARRIERAAAGNLGDVKTVRDGVSELRIDVGAGYRVYFTTRQQTLIVLLVAGDKSTQSADRYQAGDSIGKGGLNMAENLLPFDMAAMLDSDEAIIEYLSQVLAEGDTDELIRAVSHIARARGMAQIAKDSGLGRASLYKALAPGAKPRFDTIMKVIRAIGVELHATPATHP